MKFGRSNWVNLFVLDKVLKSFGVKVDIFNNAAYFCTRFGKVINGGVAELVDCTGLENRRA